MSRALLLATAVTLSGVASLAGQTSPEAKLKELAGA